MPPIMTEKNPKFLIKYGKYNEMIRPFEGWKLTISLQLNRQLHHLMLHGGNKKVFKPYTFNNVES